MELQYSNSEMNLIKNYLLRIGEITYKYFDNYKLFINSNIKHVVDLMKINEYSKEENQCSVLDTTIKSIIFRIKQEYNTFNLDVPFELFLLNTINIIENGNHKLSFLHIILDNELVSNDIVVKFIINTISYFNLRNIKNVICHTLNKISNEQDMILVLEYIIKYHKYNSILIDDVLNVIKHNINDIVISEQNRNIVISILYPLFEVYNDKSLVIDTIASIGINVKHIQNYIDNISKIIFKYGVNTDKTQQEDKIIEEKNETIQISKTKENTKISDSNILRIDLMGLNINNDFKCDLLKKIFNAVNIDNDIIINYQFDKIYIKNFKTDDEFCIKNIEGIEFINFNSGVDQKTILEQINKEQLSVMIFENKKIVLRTIIENDKNYLFVINDENNIQVVENFVRFLKNSFVNNSNKIILFNKFNKNLNDIDYYVDALTLNSYTSQELIDYITRECKAIETKRIYKYVDSNTIQHIKTVNKTIECAEGQTQALIEDKEENKKEEYKILDKQQKTNSNTTKVQQAKKCLAKQKQVKKVVHKKKQQVKKTAMLEIEKTMSKDTSKKQLSIEEFLQLIKETVNSEKDKTEIQTMLSSLVRELFDNCNSTKEDLFELISKINNDIFIYSKKNYNNKKDIVLVSTIIVNEFINNSLIKDNASILIKELIKYIINKEANKDNIDFITQYVIKVLINTIYNEYGNKDNNLLADIFENLNFKEKKFFVPFLIYYTYDCFTYEYFMQDRYFYKNFCSNYISLYNNQLFKELFMLYISELHKISISNIQDFNSINSILLDNIKLLNKNILISDFYNEEDKINVMMEILTNFITNEFKDSLSISLSILNHKKNIENYENDIMKIIYNKFELMNNYNAENIVEFVDALLYDVDNIFELCCTNVYDILNITKHKDVVNVIFNKELYGNTDLLQKLYKIFEKSDHINEFFLLYFTVINASKLVEIDSDKKIKIKNELYEFIENIIINDIKNNKTINFNDLTLITILSYSTGRISDKCEFLVNFIDKFYNLLDIQYIYKALTYEYYKFIDYSYREKYNSITLILLKNFINAILKNEKDDKIKIELITNNILNILSIDDNYEFISTILVDVIEIVLKHNIKGYNFIKKVIFKVANEKPECQIDHKIYEKLLMLGFPNIVVKDFTLLGLVISDNYSNLEEHMQGLILEQNKEFAMETVSTFVDCAIENLKNNPNKIIEITERLFNINNMEITKCVIESMQQCFSDAKHTKLQKNILKKIDKKNINKEKLTLIFSACFNNYDNILKIVVNKKDDIRDKQVLQILQVLYRNNTKTCTNLLNSIEKLGNINDKPNCKTINFLKILVLKEIKNINEALEKDSEQLFMIQDKYKMDI